MMARSREMLGIVTLLAILGSRGFVRAGETRPFIVYGAGKADLVVTRDGEEYLRFGLAAWGPNWAWAGLEGTAKSDQGAAAASLTAKIRGTATPVRIDFRASQPAVNRIQLEYAVRAEADLSLTLIAAELTPGKQFHGREVVVLSEGREGRVPCPFGRRGLGNQVETVRLSDPHGATAILRFDPPCEIASDGAARIILAKDKLSADQPRRLTITVELPQPAQFYPTAAEVPDEPGIEAWYPWRATGDPGPSVIGLEDWLDRPAGKHGRIQRRGDALVYNDRPIKLWGINLCYQACAPEKELAERRAAFYRKYGINAVRLHKFADGPGWAGIQAKHSCVEFDPQALDRMDYQIAKFKEAGIFVKLSAHFGTLKLGPADKQYVPYLEEFGDPRGNNQRVETPHSAIHYSPELQRLQAMQMVNLLRHKNPYTGLTYAEEPAIAFIEIINEQSILFFTSMAPLKASPTLRKQVGERFCKWLRQRYGDQAGLEKAWGRQALDSFQGDGFDTGGERLDKNNILPLGNPWFWDPHQLQSSQAFRKRRLLDTLAFLYELQVEFYQNYVQTLREAGYQGEFVSSNWQAGRAFSHFANLHADWLVGTIDRHNYFGGKRANASMLARAGSGMLSSGMQQVADRPFMLSEWIHVFPNEWGAEGPAIIAAYGLGLQGWDVSFLFQNGDDGHFSDRLGRQAWDVMVPQILGLFPAVARQVHRGDVLQASKVAERRVHVPSLFEGKLGFDDRVAQGYDDKELDSGQVPARSLAVVRSVVAFTDAYADTPSFDLKPYETQGQMVASTGQLRWKEAEGSAGGFFTMDTPGTKAVVGFAAGQKAQLDPVVVEPQSKFAAVYVTARQRDATIDSARELLIVAIGRARNTGMKFSPDGDQMLDPGNPPILMEPVKAVITLRKSGVPRVFVLDHDGKLTDRQIPVENSTITIDGGRDKSPYYLIRY